MPPVRADDRRTSSRKAGVGKRLFKSSIRKPPENADCFFPIGYIALAYTHYAKHLRDVKRDARPCWREGRQPPWRLRRGKRMPNKRTAPQSAAWNIFASSFRICLCRRLDRCSREASRFPALARKGLKKRVEKLKLHRYIGAILLQRVELRIGPGTTESVLGTKRSRQRKHGRT